MENTLFQSMEQFDFAPVNQRLCVGTWKNYAVTLQQYSGRNYFVFVAVRVESARSALRKSLRAALKEAGIKHCSVNQVMKNHIQATVTVARTILHTAISAASWMRSPASCARTASARPTPAPSPARPTQTASA